MKRPRLGGCRRVTRPNGAPTPICLATLPFMSDLEGPSPRLANGATTLSRSVTVDLCGDSGGPSHERTGQNVSTLRFFTVTVFALLALFCVWVAAAAVEAGSWGTAGHFLLRAAGAATITYLIYPSTPTN